MKNFLTDQHLTIAGHKVPFALVGIAVTVVLGILYLRSSANGNAAATEAAQASGTGVFGGASGSDVSGTLQNLQTQLQAFSSGLAGLSSSSPAAPAAPGVEDPASSFAASAPTFSLPIPTSLRAALAKATAPTSQPESAQPLSGRQPVYPSGPGIDSAAFPGTAQVTIPATLGGRNVPLDERVPRTYTVDLNTPRFVPFNPVRGRSTGNQAIA